MDSNITKTDIMPHKINPGYKAYFAQVDMIKRATDCRGLKPMNRAFLLDPEIFVSKPKDFPRYPWIDDANEEAE